MKTQFLFCLLIFIAVSASSQTNELRQIDSVMKIAHQRGIFNGNILIAQKGKVIYQRSFGFADGSKSRPLTGDLKFDIGSISKEFNGAAIMMLKERGMLSPEDRLSKYFPEFPAWAGSVQVRHLINYTSGIPMLGGPSADGSDSLIYASLLKLQALSFAPGTGYIYNHVNVYLQRRIIEKVSGMSYADFIRQNILKAAGMKHTAIDLPVSSAEMAAAFDNEGRTAEYATGVTGWIRLPVKDLYLWTQALHSNRVISKASLLELSNAFAEGESSLGTTGIKDGRLLWHEHQGSNYNYEALLYSYLPADITMIMMTNNQQMKVQALKATLMHILRHEPFTIPKKSLYLSIRDKFLSDVNKGLAYYQELKNTAQEQYDFSTELPDLISSGKFLQRRKLTESAISVFKAAVLLDGKTEDLSYAYELLGGCYQEKGDPANALSSYKKSLELNPGNKNAEGWLKRLSAN